METRSDKSARVRDGDFFNGGRSPPDARLRLVEGNGPMTSTTMTVARSAFKTEDLDYRFIRASMVILFSFSAMRNGSNTMSRGWNPS
jgi:hypothetical protein